MVTPIKPIEPMPVEPPVQSAFEYVITRYEEKSDALFICINSTNNPVYIEHFFTPDEMADEASRTACIEGLVAQLQIKDNEYVAPEPFTSKVAEAQALPVNVESIATKKADIISARAVI